MDQAFADAAGWHPGPVVLRKSWQRIIAAAVGSTLMPLVIPVMAVATSGRGLPVDGWTIVPLAMGIAVALLGLFADWRRALVLDAGTLTVRFALRKRQIRAADIVAVTLDREYGTRMVNVWTNDGTQHHLQVAGRGRGLLQQHFERDWHVIGQWWLANRGGDWQAPLPSVPTFATSWERLNGFDWRPWPAQQ